MNIIFKIKLVLFRGLLSSLKCISNVKLNSFSLKLRSFSSFSYIVDKENWTLLESHDDAAVSPKTDLRKR